MKMWDGQTGHPIGLPIWLLLKNTDHIFYSASAIIGLLNNLEYARS